MAGTRRDAAAAAAERSCPRCGARREHDQEYCLECGLRLPVVTDRVTSLRGGWMRRFGWYPGDWVWPALLALLVAAGGAAAAIAVSRDRTGSDSTTLVLTTASRAPAASRPQTATGGIAPDPGTGLTPVAGTPAGPGRTVWPEDLNGWTIVLISYPADEGLQRPRGTARRAANAGLPEVGVLDSSRFASLHPGYAVVFSGIYTSRPDAEAALASVRASGFGGAYVRQIAA
jgi:hypothetical protein